MERRSPLPAFAITDWAAHYAQDFDRLTMKVLMGHRACIICFESNVGHNIKITKSQE